MGGRSIQGSPRPHEDSRSEPVHRTGPDVPRETGTLLCELPSVCGLKPDWRWLTCAEQEADGGWRWERTRLNVQDVCEMWCVD